ncbi:MAG: farnesyl diphosphate synthase [Clostridia bacterium]|nr:farnesyl diphosphate synthase [Clostridia bacterium]
MDFKSKYNIYLKAVEEQIEEYFAEKDVPQKEVLDAMKYAISAGGKRIRPVLVMSVAELFGAGIKDAARVALAVECVHNYSLIHDDLPCMDDDDLRRGRPTCHKVYGESTALLAGDGLLNCAFEILSDRQKYENISAESLVAITSCLATASGVWGMIGGQVIDLIHEKRTDVTLDEIIVKHAGKTGALIRAAAVCGALCAGLAENDEKISAIDEFSSKLGLAFQIKDDILDVIGDEEVLGKPIGSDEKSGKATFVSLMGMDAASEYLDTVTSEAKCALEIFGESARFLNDLADFLLTRSY